MSLQGKTAVVTGGATGIGFAVAAALAEEGCRVAIGGRRENKLREAVQSLAGEPQVFSSTLDVADRESVKRFFNWALEQLGRVDILVNSAGTNIKNRSMAEMRPEQWDEVLAINATGAYNCLHAVLPGMRERGDGLVININSISGVRSGALGGVAYNASKFAMAALGIAVGNEDAPHGIRVTNIYPGEVNTPILDNRPVQVSDEHNAAILQPEDLAALVVTIARLPPRAHVPEVVIKPTLQAFV